MGEIFVLFIVKTDGTVKTIFTSEQVIPDNAVEPGEIAFLLQPIDILIQQALPVNAVQDKFIDPGIVGFVSGKEG
jgi:hypothetical protein